MVGRIERGGIDMSCLDYKVASIKYQEGRRSKNRESRFNRLKISQSELLRNDPKVRLLTEVGLLLQIIGIAMTVTLTAVNCD